MFVNVDPLTEIIGISPVGFVWPKCKPGLTVSDRPNERWMATKLLR
jgi:hypothetical protein